MNRCVMNHLKKKKKGVIMTYDVAVVGAGVVGGLIARELSRFNNRITAKEVAESLSVSLRQGERIMATLKEKGLIKRVGSNKSGHWEVVE